MTKVTLILLKNLNNNFFFYFNIKDIARKRYKKVENNYNKKNPNLGGRQRANSVFLCICWKSAMAPTRYKQRRKILSFQLVNYTKFSFFLLCTHYRQESILFRKYYIPRLLLLLTVAPNASSLVCDPWVCVYIKASNEYARSCRCRWRGCCWLLLTSQGEPASVVSLSSAATNVLFSTAAQVARHFCMEIIFYLFYIYYYIAFTTTTTPSTLLCSSAALIHAIIIGCLYTYLKNYIILE